MPDPSKPAPEQNPPQPMTDPTVPPMRDPPGTPYRDPVQPPPNDPPDKPMRDPDPPPYSDPPGKAAIRFGEGAGDRRSRMAARRGVAKPRRVIATARPSATEAHSPPH